jgi:hypothetical protein
LRRHRQRLVGLSFRRRRRWRWRQRDDAVALPWRGAGGIAALGRRRVQRGMLLGRRLRRRKGQARRHGDEQQAD